MNKRQRVLFICSAAAAVALLLLVIVLDKFNPAVTQTQFQLATTGNTLINHQKSVDEPNKDGTIHYLYDNFDSYGNVNSKLLAGFETTNDTQVTSATHLGTSTPAYEGTKSLAFTAKSAANSTMIVTHTFSSAQDLSRWKNSGYVSAWLHVPSNKGIASASIQLGNANGSYREYSALPNLQTDYPDIYNKNDLFPDLPYPETTSSSEWTDFSLKPGWNFLPWRMDSGFFADHGQPDLAAVAWFKIVFHTTSNVDGQQILLDDVRVQDGLQKQSNPTAGNWYPPLGMPQYGVYDINQVSGNNYALKLQNVRQTQYPSNGDHGRMLSKYGSPTNFAMRTRFELNNVGDNGGDLTNTWLRIFYDFDPEYDPGHDWFGSYFSLDYKQIGLITVIPVQRFSVQTQEPKESQKETNFRQNFAPKANTQYEYNLTVKGQYAQATIYEVGKNGAMYQRASVQYTFNRPRNNKHYPIGIEVTGDVKATVYEVEVVQL